MRDAASNELDDVALLLVSCFREYLSTFPQEVGDAYLREVADVRARASSSQLLVAEADGRLVGAVTFLPDARHDGHPWPPEGSVLRLLAVDPAARGAGVGGRLTVECIGRARRDGAAFIGLHTAPFMHSARALYERLGFVRAPEHDFDPRLYYGGSGHGASEEEALSLKGLAYLLPLTRSSGASHPR